MVITTNSHVAKAPPRPPEHPLLAAYKLRWKRRKLLLRALRKRRQLTAVSDRTGNIAPGDILAVSTMRNERIRLPHFLDYHRSLGVKHFLIVDNDSDDGTSPFLTAQPDVSLWHTAAGYKQSRFGVDWTTWLQMKFAHGHWCLALDADEILVYPHCDTRPLSELTRWLDDAGQRSFGAMMLDMYPCGSLATPSYEPGADPFQILSWFDAGNYSVKRQEPMGNLWIQGGVRARRFFTKDPRRAPTLNKTPLVKWSRTFAYVSSTHSLLPPSLNEVYDRTGAERLSGVLLHTKFLPMVVERSVSEKQRQEHFANSRLYDDYYDNLAADPNLWCPQSTRYRGWRQLERLGLMSRGTWI